MLPCMLEAGLLESSSSPTAFFNSSHIATATLSYANVILILFLPLPLPPPPPHHPRYVWHPVILDPHDFAI